MSLLVTQKIALDISFVTQKCHHRVFAGNVNGVNVIGLALQGPSVPSIAVLHHNGPYNIQTPSTGKHHLLQRASAYCFKRLLNGDNIISYEINSYFVVLHFLDVNQAQPLEPRPATTGSVDVLPLQPKYLPSFDREYRSEPREIPSSADEDNSFANRTSFSTGKMMETELGLASVPAMAIGSSTEILVSIVENQARLRRNSFLSVNSKQSNTDLKSPDYDNVKSPSTEFTTNSSLTTPATPHNDDRNFTNNLDRNDNEEKVCDNKTEQINNFNNV